ncbi:MAG: hypothetical protein WCL00_01710 [Bacteroidota bacterium]
MEGQFSFTENPVRLILEKLPALLPGIEKVIAVFHNDEKREIGAFITQLESSGYWTGELEVETNNERIKHFRRENSPYTWIRQQDIPFDVVTEQQVQLTIFNESDNNILLIRKKSESDSLNDLFFIYLNSNIGNFRLLNNSKSLSTETKTVIGQLIRNSILMIESTIKNDREVFQVFRENNGMVLGELGHLRQEKNKMEEKYVNGILHLCKIHLSGISKERNRIFRFSDDGILKLKEFEGDIGQLKSIVEKAARYAETIQFETGTEVIEISDYHLIFRAIPEPAKVVSRPAEQPVSDLDPRYLKTYNLLNKLENAAQSLKNRNQLITSANVGKELPKGISAAAISDALKKHLSKIIILFNKFPSHWELIRTEFRPVQNALNTIRDLQKNSA